MATLAVQLVTPAGLAPVYSAAAAGGDQFANVADGRTFLHAKNAGGGALTVTAVRQRTSLNVPGEQPITLGNIAVSVPLTNGDRMIGPFPESFNDINGNVQLTYSGVTSLTVAVVRVPAI